MLTSTARAPWCAEIQLDLLKGPLDQERRVGVHDRPQPGQRQPAGHADHELLPDSHVQHPLRVPRRRLGEQVGRDLRQHHRRQRILIQQRRSGLGRKPSAYPS